MFTMTEEWLYKYYGSKDEHQERDAVNWLKQYGVGVSEADMQSWKRWKHLVEYQVNTHDIVAQALGRVGFDFVSELDAHRFINRLRVPGQSDAYIEALSIVDPSTIMELGVGGDSAISTAIFLAHIEGKKGRRMVSVDRNPLGCTWTRYGKVPFWQFIQGDSVEEMQKQADMGQRFDLVFIDTIHDYPHTKRELEVAVKLTDYILMDDVTFTGNSFDSEPGGVKRAIEEWTPANSDTWQYREFVGKNVGLMYRRTKRTSRKVLFRKNPLAVDPIAKHNDV